MAITHSLICGVTMSGKTTLARAFAQHFCKKGEKVIVYDPLGTHTANGADWGEGAIVFRDDFQFFDYLTSDGVSHAHVFIDESADLFSLENRDNFWLATRGRHFGFQLYFIAQRPKMLAPTVRNQCGFCYMFRLSKDDSKEISADFGHDYPDIIKNPEGEIKPLDTGDYLVLTSGNAKIQRYNIFNQLNEAKNAINP